MIQKTLVFNSSDEMEDATQEIMDDDFSDEKDDEDDNYCVEVKKNVVVRKPKAPAGYIAFTWKTKKDETWGMSVQICPECKTFGSVWEHQGFTDPIAKGIARAIRQGKIKPEEEWNEWLYWIESEQCYLRDHWSRFGQGHCMQCKIKFWHDFKCEHGEMCSCGKWQYYYKPKGQEVLQ